MAEFKFNCPQCGQTIEADDSIRGQVAECPHCGKGIVVPRGKSKLSPIRKGGTGESKGQSIPPGQKHSRTIPTFKEHVAIPERLAQPTQDQVVPPDKTRAKGWSRKNINILLVLIVFAAIAGAASYGGYLYFGDIPRLERGIAHYENKGYANALRLLLPLAQKGNALAQLYVGDCYAEGNGVIMDTEEAVKWYETAAASGLVEAWQRMYKHGIAHYETKAYAKAIKLLLPLAKRGDAKAQLHVGDCYAEGEGAIMDTEEAVKWYKAAADQGFAEALQRMYKLGVAHYKNKTYSQAIKLLLPLAEKGNSKAQLHVGDCYANGVGVIMDTEEAVKWYKAAADQDNAAAQYRMYKCCRYGIGIERNLENAAKWCRKAANAGFLEAMFDMAELYMKGLGVEEDEKNVFKWYGKGAQQGYPPSQYQFGWCYKVGIGVRKDEDEAAKWQNKAVSAWRKGANAGDTDSMVRIGNLYMNGDVVELDQEKATQWYRKAAEADDARGQLKLALCYLEGNGMEKDTEEAAKWMLKAAEQGVDDESQWYMGRFYYNGVGVAKDFKEAVKWLNNSAQKGLPKAKYDLAICYLRGDGVKNDVDKAEQLLEEAANTGYEDAKKKLDEIKYERDNRAKAIAELSCVENKIEELKSHINNILKGKDEEGNGKDNLMGFDASKITMLDASVPITEEQPLQRLSEKISDKDTTEAIVQLKLEAQKSMERLQTRFKDIARVKDEYVKRELESRKTKCAPCGGTGFVACTRCKGQGEVISNETLPCPTCNVRNNSYEEQNREGQVRTKVDCFYCRRSGTVSLKCKRCGGRGTVKGADRDSSGKIVLDNRIVCSTCGGDKTVTKTCPKCHGTRWIYVWKKCQTCDGRGTVTYRVTCPICKGKSKCACEHCDGRGFIYSPRDTQSDVGHGNNAGQNEQ